MGGWDDLDDDEPEDEAPPENPPVPWDRPDYGASRDARRRPRHNAFTPARRAKFLKRLARYANLADAARRTGVSTRTVYNHQDKDEAFARDCAHALRMAASALERAAYERAVEGVDQLFACGGQVHVRKHYSDSLLRLLLQGADRGKYGPRPGMSRKRLLAWERKKLKQEVEAEQRAKRRSPEEIRDSILTKLAAFDRRDEAERLAAGWIRDDAGNWIPPGWVRAADAALSNGP